MSLRRTLLILTLPLLLSACARAHGAMEISGVNSDQVNSDQVMADQIRVDQRQNLFLI